MMRRAAAMALMVAVLGSAVPSGGQAGNQKQSQGQPVEKKLEALLTAAEMPFTRMEEGRYIAVITVEDNESEKFYVSIGSLGDDPNDEKGQVITTDFLLGRLPQGATPSTALIKQMAQWNANLTFGKVFAAGNAIIYSNSYWFSRVTSETLAWDAAVSHYAAQGLRKEVAPYLKQ